MSNPKKECSRPPEVSQPGSSDISKPNGCTNWVRMDKLQDTAEMLQSNLTSFAKQIGSLKDDFSKDMDDAVIANANLLKENDGLYEQMDICKEMYIGELVQAEGGEFRVVGRYARGPFGERVADEGEWSDLQRQC